MGRARFGGVSRIGMGLGVAIALAALLQLPTLGLKPPWGDEWSTIVFSLGAGFRGLPLNELLSLDELLTPARGAALASWGEVWQRLSSESNHPPLFFWIMNSWFQLGASLGGLEAALGQVPLLWSRGLAAGLGVLTVPIGFGVARAIGLSQLGALATAWLLALSPYGVYLGQEARHYTLAMIWELLSLGLLGPLLPTEGNGPKRRFQPLMSLAWAWVNVLGVATHLFVGLFVAAEGLVLAGRWWGQWRRGGRSAILTPAWGWIYGALVPLFLGIGFWPLLWRRDTGNGELVAWLGSKETWLEAIFGPLGRMLAWTATMVAAGPVEGVPIAVAIVAGLGVLGTLGWLFPHYRWVWRELRDKPLAQFLGWVLAATLGIVLVVSYGTGLDLTLAARYQFVYWPTLMLLGGLALERFWEGRRRWVVGVTLGLMLVGGLSVSGNWAYQKPDQPDRVMAALAQTYGAMPVGERDRPLILAVVHTSHEQAGEAMGLAWEWWRQRSRSPETWPLPQPQFVLVKRDTHRDPMPALVQSMKGVSRPYDLVTFNFRGGWKPEVLGCEVEPKAKGTVAGYRYRLNRCS